MADIRCPNCGKNNPDFLDRCQFCQASLKPESTLHIGEKPTKKNTGELEPVLPDWLRDVRQQARDAAEEDSAQTAFMPKVQKEEPPDLLAGLASQARKADDEEVPDWLQSLTSTAKKQPPAAQSAPPETDFFAQFEPAKPVPEEAPGPEPNNLNSREQATDHDELSEWFTQASEQSAEPFTLESEIPQFNAGWDNQTSSPAPAEQPAPKEEDLSWLRNLEEEAKKTGELPAPKQQQDWSTDLGGSSAPSSDQQDLSWLDNLGSLPASDVPAQQPFESQQDLSWLNNLGGTPLPEQSAQPPEDLGWLNAFKDSAQPAQPPTAESQPDLSWLNELGSSQIDQPSQQAPAASEQPASTEDLSWLSSLQGSADSLSAAPFTEQPAEQSPPVPAGNEIPHVAPFTPRRTAPLSEEDDSTIPDWLKSATEGPSLPLGSEALDQFREDYKIPTGPEEPFSWKNFVPAPEDDQPEQDKPQPAFVNSDPFGTRTESTLSNQDVDSLFSMEMPDWLSKSQSEAGEPRHQEEIGIHAEGGEALTPADLPSWVQAMRPVEAVISETAALEDQPTEREGPLAGLKGVIPAAPIGSSRRPQPIPLKLQASDEQQASAAILEQILASETSAHALRSAPTVSSQRVLRQAIALLVWVVLGAMILMRTQWMPVSGVLPPDARDVSNVIAGIPNNSQVLVVVDYQPSLAGELEAVSGPLLDQVVLTRHPRLSFLANSPSGAGLVERLLANTNINKPEGLGYRPGENYFQLGYLPGGESGVLTFLQSPRSVSALVNAFSEYKAVILLTDHADSARVWVEQLQSLKQTDPTLAGQPLLVASSAQAGPMLQPYVSSGQINGLINGLSDAARFEFLNNSRPGIARSYWDAFGTGILMALVLIILGSVWSLITGIRARRAEAAEA